VQDVTANAATTISAIIKIVRFILWYLKLITAWYQELAPGNSKENGSAESGYG